MEIVFNIFLIIVGLYIPQLIQLGLLWIGLKFKIHSQIIVHPNKREFFITILMIVMLIISIEMNYQIPNFVEKMIYGSSLTLLYYMYRYFDFKKRTKGLNTESDNINKDIFLKKQMTKQVVRMKDKGFTEKEMELHLFDMFDITLEIIQKVQGKEYFKFFDKEGEGLMWTIGLKDLDRKVLKNLYICTTIGLFLKKLKTKFGEDVENLTNYVNEYINYLFFDGNNVFITFLDVTDSITPSEFEERGLDKSELVKMWNSRIFNERLCSITPKNKQLYNKLDESLMLMWYLDFMVKISKDTDELVSDFESKDNFEKYFL